MKNQRENKPTGRPTKYKKEYAELAYNYCLLGATDAQLGEFFGVNELTINRWKTDHPDFCKSLKAGKHMSDAEVAHSLYKRACGYKTVEVRTKELPSMVENGDSEMSVSEVTTIVKEFPPDTTACIFWLKNRQPKYWRDKAEVDHSHKMDKEFTDSIEENFLSKMREAHERQRQVFAERGINKEAKP